MRKVKKEKLKTIGVRFTSGGMIYTYKIRAGAKVHLGQELIATGYNNERKGVWVVRIDKTPQIPCGYTMESLKQITEKVAPI